MRGDLFQTYFIVTFFLTISITLNAQDTIVFKYLTLPNSTYKTSMLTDTKSSTMMEGLFDDAMKGNNSMTSVFTTKTGEWQDSLLPILIDYDSLVMIQKMEMLPDPIKTNLLQGTKIFGKIDVQNITTIDSIVGDVDTNFKNMLQESFTKMNQAITFPKEAMKVGDDFFQEAVLPISIPSNEPVEIILKTTYTLKRIEKEKAFFDLKQEYLMNATIEATDFFVNGDGTGKLVFNIKDYYSENLESNMEMEMIFEMNSLKVNSKSMVHTKMEIELIRE